MIKTSSVGCPQCGSLAVAQLDLGGELVWLSVFSRIDDLHEAEVINASISFCPHCGGYLPQKHDILILKPEYDTCTWTDWGGVGTSWTFQFWKGRERVCEINVVRNPPKNTEVSLGTPVAQIMPFFMPCTASQFAGMTMNIKNTNTAHVIFRDQIMNFGECLRIMKKEKEQEELS